MHMEAAVRLRLLEPQIGQAHLCEGHGCRRDLVELGDQDARVLLSKDEAVGARAAGDVEDAEPVERRAREIRHDELGQCRRRREAELHRRVCERAPEFVRIGALLFSHFVVRIR